MILTVTDRKYFKPYNHAGNHSRWQTDVMGQDIAALLARHGVRYEMTSDESWTLISWSTPQMQLWISIECIDVDAPTFQLDIGAGKRVLFLFARSFPDAVFANEPWMVELKELAGGRQLASGSGASLPFPNR